MSEQQQEERTPEAAPAVNPPATPPAASAPRPERHHGNGVGWLALLLALGAGAGAGYVWLNQERTAAQWQGNNAGLAAELKSINDRAQLDANRDNELHQQMQQIAQQFDNLDRNVQQLMAMTGDAGRHWMLVESEFLLRNAGYRLQLERDVASSIAALQDADRQLERYADPALQPLREIISQQIASLQAVNLPDVAGLSASLSALLADLDKLPLPSPLKGVNQPTGAAPASHEGEPAWKAAMLKLWDQLKALVVVRHGEKAEAPLMPPDQSYFLYMNLRLKLEAARLALLQGNEQVWHDSLSQAGKWLQGYFDTRTPAVRSAQQTLAQLGQQTIRPPLPDISAGLQMLREFMLRHPGTVAPAPMPTQPMPTQPMPTQPAPAAAEPQAKGTGL